MPKKKREVDLETQLRWTEVFHFFIQGLSQKEIAEELDVQLATIIDDFEELKLGEDYFINPLEERRAKVLKYYIEGFHYRTVARFLGVSTTTVLTEQALWKKRGKIVPVQIDKFSKENQQKVLKLYKKGLSKEKIWKRMKGLSKKDIDSIFKLLKEQGKPVLDHNDKKALWAKRQNDVLDLAKQGKEVDEIATILNLSTSRIYADIAYWRKKGEYFYLKADRERLEKVLEGYNKPYHTYLGVNIWDIADYSRNKSITKKLIQQDLIYLVMLGKIDAHDYRLCALLSCNPSS